MNNFIWLWLIPSCFGIAFFDFIIFRKWTACIKCGHEADKWYNFLLPTVLEILLFLAGIGIGAKVYG